ncbi:MAG: FHIPEP family type III secretion protein, partial [Desulfobacterales bacterium]
MADQTHLTGQIPMATKNSDIMMAVAVIGILVFMVMPLPTFLLDLLLSFSITFSLIILLASMYVPRPLDLSAFPSILLLATLFR